MCLTMASCSSRLTLYTHFRLIGRYPGGGSTSFQVSFSSIAFISSSIVRRQFPSRSASANVGGYSILMSSSSWSLSSQPARPEGPVPPTMSSNLWKPPTMSSNLWNRTSSPSWKASTNLVCHLEVRQTRSASMEFPVERSKWLEGR